MLLIACASTAELFGTSALCPFEAARIRMVAEPDFAPSLLAAMRKLAGDGLGPLYGGLPVILLKMVRKRARERIDARRSAGRAMRSALVTARRHARTNKPNR